jgi:hypothetical protein
MHGVGSAPVRAVTAGEVSAWVSDAGDGLAWQRATDELVRVHDAVIRAAMVHETPLPARFGQTFPDDSALRSALEERSEAIRAALDRVAGAVEMTVRMLLDIEPSGAVGPPPVSSGRDYLAWVRARRTEEAELRRRAEFLQARLGEAVQDVVRGEARAPVRFPARSLAVSHLVAREALMEYRLAVRSFAEGDPARRIMLSGPWAPYSFAELHHD